MTNSQRHSRALLLSALVLACLWAVPGLFLGHVQARQAPPTDWITAAAVQLRAAQAEEWLNARSAALSRPAIEIQALVAWLNRADGSPVDRTLALILQTRTAHPQTAQEYDQAVARSLSDPVIGHAGNPMYHTTMPKHTDLSYSLGIELMWKRIELPENLRWAPYPYFRAPVPFVEPVLVVLAENPSKGSELAPALCLMSKAHPDPRVIPALLDNYRYARENKPDDTGHAHRVMAFTAMLGTADAAAAVLQMREIERAHMQAHGWAPWDDEDAENALRQASQALAQSRQHRPLPGSQEPLTQPQQQYEDTLKRHKRHWLWERFDRTLNDLRAQGLILEP